jgi:hypothetical protein
VTSAARDTNAHGSLASCPAAIAAAAFKVQVMGLQSEADCSRLPAATGGRSRVTVARCQTGNDRHRWPGSKSFSQAQAPSLPSRNPGPCPSRLSGLGGSNYQRCPAVIARLATSDRTGPLQPARATVGFRAGLSAGPT